MRRSIKHEAGIHRPESRPRSARGMSCLAMQALRRARLARRAELACHGVGLTFGDDEPYGPSALTSGHRV